MTHLTGPKTKRLNCRVDDVFGYESIRLEKVHERIDLMPAKYRGLVIDRVLQVQRWGLYPNVDDVDSILRQVKREDESIIAAANVVPPAPVRKPSTIYYLRLGDRVKIGTTTNLAMRLRAIPHDELLGTEPGDHKVERARHVQFAKLHHSQQSGTEWFAYVGDLRDHIARLQAKATASAA